MGRTSGFTKEKCVSHRFITKAREKRNKANLWIWISLDYNQMFPLGAVHLLAEEVQNLPNQLILIVWLNGGEPR